MSALPSAPTQPSQVANHKRTPPSPALRAAHWHRRAATRAWRGRDRARHLAFPEVQRARCAPPVSGADRSPFPHSLASPQRHPHPALPSRNHLLPLLPPPPPPPPPTPSSPHQSRARPGTAPARCRWPRRRAAPRWSTSKSVGRRWRSAQPPRGTPSWRGRRRRSASPSGPGPTARTISTSPTGGGVARVPVHATPFAAQVHHLKSLCP